MSVLGVNVQLAGSTIIDLGELCLRALTTALTDRTGGAFVFADRLGRPLTTHVVGCLTPEKYKKYTEFAREKAARLGEHGDHISSWQSRNVDESKFGGAIRCAEMIYSFSGFPEMWDEALMISLGLRSGRLATSESRQIIAVSNNVVLPHFDPPADQAPLFQ